MAPFLSSPFSVNKTTRLTRFLSLIQAKSAGKENMGFWHWLFKRLHLEISDLFNEICVGSFIYKKETFGGRMGTKKIKKIYSYNRYVWGLVTSALQIRTLHFNGFFFFFFFRTRPTVVGFFFFSLLLFLFFFFPVPAQGAARSPKPRFRGRGDGSRSSPPPAAKSFSVLRTGRGWDTGGGTRSPF